jgi:HD-GYP domain-containing protein (c-di-GMP phosphodiesterase class II)
MTTRKIDVNNVKIGMYVAQLDRPWLETPFLFQGFYVRDQDDVNELKKYCEYVYILRDDAVGQADDVFAPARAAPLRTDDGAGAIKRRWRRMSAFIWRRKGKTATPSRIDGYAQPGTFYEDTRTLQEELSDATSVHNEAAVTVHQVISKLRVSDRLDIQQLETVVTPMVASILRNPSALSCLVRLQKKDDYLYHHSLGCLVWATVLGRHVGLSREDLKVIAMGALLIDVGKIRLPGSILRKAGELDPDEETLSRRHVEYSLDILKETGGLDPRVMQMVATHHERYNGTGYPRGLKGSEIPVFGRIAGLVDTYDAMTTPRPYAKAMSSYDAFRQLRKIADVEFQAELIDQFTLAVGVFPTGTLVELNTGEVAVVTKQNRIRRLRPEIMIIMNANKELLETFLELDLNKESVSEDGRHSLWIEHGLAPGSFGLDPTEFFLD